MRVVALEEHFSIPRLANRISAEAKSRRGFKLRTVLPGKVRPEDLLPDFSEVRLASMDAAGITVQVLSMGGPGADLVDGPDGVVLAREFNDALAAEIARKPDRFAGFAHLPMRSPEAAADELTRSVRKLGFHGAMINGTTDDRFLDDARFAPILAAAEALDVPIYLHPHLAPEAVRKAYYSGLPGSAGAALETTSWGWHSETALHLLRLVFAGTFDRHPKLKFIIGHMGEGLPVMMARIEEVSAHHVGHLSRSVTQTIHDQVWITTSGIFTQPPLLAALQTFGIDRMMFSVDYPFTENENGRRFLAELTMAPADRAKLTHGTADRLLRLRAVSGST